MAINRLHRIVHQVVSFAFLVSLLSPLGAVLPAAADTQPPSGTPATVSDDALPTVQIDGIVWAQTIVGNTVFATGDFSTARPAGVPKGGTGTVTRSNLLAYDITTGKLLSFNHSLNAEGRAIAVSPDHSKLYVGGAFTTVDGKSHPHIAQFSLSNGGLVSTFTGGTNGMVRALTASNTVVYAGGSFSEANNQARSRLVAFLSSGALTGWVPSTNALVEAMTLTPDNSKVVIGGPFTQLNGKTYYGMGAVSANTPGAAVNWASQSSTFPIRDVDPANAKASITSFSTNSNTVFLTAFNFNGANMPGGFEGRAAISPTDGHIIFINDCHGDTYSAVPIGSVLYSVGHAHDCQPAGAFPETNPRTWHRALAETITVSGTDGPSTNGYNSFYGQPRTSQLDWYPDLAVGSVSGASQAAWSVTGNSDYISLGGEFPKVNGVAQQGLARFAISSKAPNKMGPRAFTGTPIIASRASSTGTATISLNSTWDPDNAVLTYRLYRDKGSTPITTYTTDSRFWRLPVHTYTDKGLAPGSSHSYRVTASDPFGNMVTSAWISSS